MKAVKLIGAAAVIVLAVVLVHRHLKTSDAATPTKPLPTAAELHAPFHPFLPAKLPAGFRFEFTEPPARPDDVWLWFRTRDTIEVDLMEGSHSDHPTLLQVSLGRQHPVSRHLINGRTWVFYKPGSALVTTTSDGVDLLIRNASLSQSIALARTLRQASS